MRSWHDTRLKRGCLHREAWNNLLFQTTGTPPGIAPRDSAPHSEGMNIMYCDGHAKWMKNAQFLTQCPPRAQYTATFSTPTRSSGNPTMAAAPTWTGEWPLWGLNL